MKYNKINDNKINAVLFLHGVHAYKCQFKKHINLLKKSKMYNENTIIVCPNMINQGNGPIDDITLPILDNLRRFLINNQNQYLKHNPLLNTFR